MSVIDERGKLGGKINIIDLIVILVILAAVVAVAVLGSRGNQNSAQAEHIRYVVEVQGVDEDVYESIRTQLPAQLLSSDELQNGYVTAVEGEKVTENDVARIEAAKSTYYVGLHPGQAGTYDVLVTIEADLTDPLSSKLGSQEIRVGRSHIVKTTLFELDHGIIVSREDIPAEG
jgi:FlaG/FlaF family flagellin (archaellin)